MHGTLHVIPPDNKFHRLISLKELPTLFKIEAAVRGPIHVIPGFDSVLLPHTKTIEPCIAFCNEHSQTEQLEQNTWANLLWLQAQVRDHGFSGTMRSKIESLRGPIALLWGDVEFLGALQSGHVRRLQS